MDRANINKTYSGSRIKYSLDVRGDEDIAEYLAPDKTTVLYGNRAAQIALPGDIEQTNKALQLISEHCKAENPKVSF